jgi:hypothetical protein
MRFRSKADRVPRSQWCAVRLENTIGTQSDAAEWLAVLKFSIAWSLDRAAGARSVGTPWREVVPSPSARRALVP